MKKIVLLLAFCLSIGNLFAQDADKLRDEGDAALKAKNYAEAFTKYDAFLKQTNNEDADRVFNCGFAAFQAKKYEDAVKYYDLAIQKNKNVDVGKCLYPFLYLGLHFCGNPFQLQRLFCGMWKVLYRISAQYNFDYICACSGFVSGIEIFYRYAVSNGTCGTGGVTGIRGNLCDCIYIVKEKKPCGTDSMNQDGKSFNR